jgi:hypothetical protein
MEMVDRETGADRQEAGTMDGAVDARRGVH